MQTFEIASNIERMDMDTWTAMEEWEGGSQMGSCWDTENESLNNWEI